MMMVELEGKSKQNSTDWLVRYIMGHPLQNMHFLLYGIAPDVLVDCQSFATGTA